MIATVPRLTHSVKLEPRNHKNRSSQDLGRKKNDSHPLLGLNQWFLSLEKQLGYDSAPIVPATQKPEPRNKGQSKVNLNFI